MLDRLNWRLPGCGEGCTPRRHDPYAHELHGYLLALRSPPIRKTQTGPLEIDLDTRTVRLYGKLVDNLSRGPNVGVVRWKLLEILVANIGKTVSYEEIIRYIYDSDVNDADTRHAVVMLIWYVRKELAPVRHLFVTVANIGARLEKEAPYVQETRTPPDQPQCSGEQIKCSNSVVLDTRKLYRQARYIPMPCRPEAQDELRSEPARQADRRACGTSDPNEDAAREYEAVLGASEEDGEG